MNQAIAFLKLFFIAIFSPRHRGYFLVFLNFVLNGSGTSAHSIINSTFFLETELLKSGSILQFKDETPFVSDQSRPENSLQGLSVNLDNEKSIFEKYIFTSGIKILNTIENLYENESEDGILSFNVSLTNGVVNLSWTTPGNVSKETFAIERSKDGILFEVIHTEILRRNSNENCFFNAIDNKPNPGKNIYRIRETHPDKNALYSEAAAVIHNTIDFPNELKIISLVENPFTGNWEIDFFVPDSGVFDLTLMNFFGKRISFGRVEATTGFNSFEFFKNHATLKGTCFVTLSRDDLMVLEKIER